MDDYNAQLCQEIHRGVDARLNAHSNKIDNHDLILHGNGKDGMVSKLNRVYEWYVHQTATRSGLLDWAFRAIILIVLSYIAAKVGLK